MTTTTILETLVGFDTTSRASNLPLIEFAVDHLAAHGVEATVVANDAGTKANVWATIGPAVAGGVILSGHTDCVPVDGQPWSTDPFALTKVGGRWHGRGTADMKGFVASALAAVPMFVEAPLVRPVHLALSYDEELGGAGARLLVADMAAGGIRPGWCVVGEPTSMRVVTAHKGIFVFSAQVTGTEAHSSLAPRAVNAAEYAARLVVALQEMARAKAETGPFDDVFDIPHTTVHAGVIRSGTALNIVPRLAEVEFEFRHLPGDDPEAIRDRIDRVVSQLSAEMRETAPGCGIELTVRAHLPALDTDPSAEVVARVGALTEERDLAKVAYGTEAGLFESVLGVPTVVCGPGSIDQAHRPDEYVEVAQLDACDRFMGRLAAVLAAD